MDVMISQVQVSSNVLREALVAVGTFEDFLAGVRSMMAKIARNRVTSTENSNHSYIFRFTKVLNFLEQSGNSQSNGRMSSCIFRWFLRELFSNEVPHLELKVNFELTNKVWGVVSPCAKCAVFFVMKEMSSEIREILPQAILEANGTLKRTCLFFMVSDLMKLQTGFTFEFLRANLAADIFFIHEMSCDVLNQWRSLMKL